MEKGTVDMFESDDMTADSELCDGLTPELERIAQLLADGRSHASAAAPVNRSAKFVQRALNNNRRFANRVRQLKEERAAQAAAGLGALLDEAVAAVERALQSGRTIDELRAASLVFDRYRVFHADSEAKERLRELQTEIDDLRLAISSLESTKTPRRDAS